MKKQPPITLASANSKPLRSFGNRSPLLKLVLTRMTSKAQTNTPETTPPVERVAVLQVLLTAERAFVRKLQTLVEERCSIMTEIDRLEIDKLKQKINNEDVFQIARFFFLLEELNCSTPAAVKTLLIEHNARIKNLIENEDFRFGSLSVLRRAHFDDNQISIVVLTIEQKPRPVFSKHEIASLLFEQMKRSKATAIIDLMVQAKLLEEELAIDRTERERVYTSNRSYINTDGAIENAVADYLEAVHLGLREIS